MKPSVGADLMVAELAGAGRVAEQQHVGGDDAAADARPEREHHEVGDAVARRRRYARRASRSAHRCRPDPRAEPLGEAFAERRFGPAEVRASRGRCPSRGRCCRASRCRWRGGFAWPCSRSAFSDRSPTAAMTASKRRSSMSSRLRERWCRPRPRSRPSRANRRDPRLRLRTGGFAPRSADPPRRRAPDSQRPRQKVADDETIDLIAHAALRELRASPRETGQPTHHRAARTRAVAASQQDRDRPKSTSRSPTTRASTRYYNTERDHAARVVVQVQRRSRVRAAVAGVIELARKHLRDMPENVACPPGCAECCSGYEPFVSREDVQRIAEHFGMTYARR